jgi:cytoskeletal protein CcmA (bactofilin family)
MWNREAASRTEAAQAPKTAAPILPARALEERRIAWVGKSVVFRGDLISLEDMTIDGQVEGTIDLREHTLTIGPDAHIHADVVAKVVTILGAVTGIVTAGEIVNIHETGSVDGDIKCPKLAMADGAVLRGRVDAGTRAANG